VADVTVRTLKIKLDADGTLVVSGVESAKRKLGELGRESQTLSQRMQGHWQSFKQQWIGVAAGVTAAIVALRQAWDMAEFAAKFEEQKEAVGNLAREWGVGADEMIRAIQEQARGLVSLADAADIAAKAFAHGFSPAQIFELTRVAERFSDVWGGDVAESVDKLSQAIATGQTRMLKQVGIVMDTEAVIRSYAESLGVARDRLTEAGERQAIFEETMRQAEQTIARLGPATDSAADRMDRMKAQWEDIKLSVGQFLLRVGSGLLALGDMIAVQWNFWLNIIFKGLREVDEALAIFGITSGQHFQDNVAETEKAMNESIAAMKQNWADMWAEAPKVQERALAEIVANQKAAGEALVKAIPPEARIPTRAEDIEISKEQWAEWEAEKYRMEQEGVKREKILYNGQTEEEFRQWEERVQIVSGALGSMANMFQTFANIQGAHQGAAFALFKAFAIAQAVIDTHAAYMRALATLPPPFSYIAAAAAIAAGIARVAAIASTQPNTGSTAVASSVGTGTAGVTPPADQTTGGSSGPTIINFHFSGARVVDRRAMDEFARDFAPSLARARQDGARF
jgi:hypothetical protein